MSIEPGSLTILFEDAQIYAIDKPIGIASIPEGNKEQKSLRELLEAKAGQKIYVVHRLDKEVSGVILFAKNAAMHKYLNDRFSSREVQKTYRALVHGEVRDDSGVIDAPLREFGSGRVGVDHENGKPSLTEYRVLSREGGYSLLELSPQSGRRHQLRAHLYSIGHPIVGDVRYGDRAKQQTYPRLMLHAHKIECRLPNGERLVVESALPSGALRAPLDLRDFRC